MSQLEEEVYTASFSRELLLRLMARGYESGDIADAIGSSTQHASMILKEPNEMTVRELKIVLKMLQPNRNIAKNFLLGAIYK